MSLVFYTARLACGFLEAKYARYMAGRGEMTGALRERRPLRKHTRKASLDDLQHPLRVVLHHGMDMAGRNARLLEHGTEIGQKIVQPHIRGKIGAQALVGRIQAEDDLPCVPCGTHLRDEGELLRIADVFETVHAVIAEGTACGQHLQMILRVIVGAVQMADQQPLCGEMVCGKPAD